MEDFIDTMSIKVQHTQHELQQIVANLAKEVKDGGNKMDTRSVLKISSSVPRPLTRIRSNIDAAKKAANDPVGTKVSDLIGDIFT